MKKRKLPPYQYKLRLRLIPEPKRPTFYGPHIVYYDGQFHVYRNKWKSQFRGPKLYAAAISAPTIRELTQKILKAHDGWRFGANYI